jgi:hypothetical protein
VEQAPCLDDNTYIIGLGIDTAVVLHIAVVMMLAMIHIDDDDDDTVKY